MGWRSAAAAPAARDVWVQPSAGMIRHWGQTDRRGFPCATDDQTWVGEECSGIRCVDEVDQDRRAIVWSATRWGMARWISATAHAWGTGCGRLASTRTR